MYSFLVGLTFLRLIFSLFLLLIRNWSHYSELILFFYNEEMSI